MEKINIKFTFDNDRPIYVQLVEQLEILIISGEIASGEKLPSVREFALITKVNPNTMQKALSELESSGLIYTERTNGKYVTEDRSLIIRRRNAFANNKARQYLDDMCKLGFGKDESIEFLINESGEKS